MNKLKGKLGPIARPPPPPFAVGEMVSADDGRYAQLVHRGQRSRRAAAERERAGRATRAARDAAAWKPFSAHDPAAAWRKPIADRAAGLVRKRKQERAAYRKAAAAAGRRTSGWRIPKGKHAERVRRTREKLGKGYTARRARSRRRRRRTRRKTRRGRKKRRKHGKGRKKTQRGGKEDKEMIFKTMNGAEIKLNFSPRRGRPRTPAPITRDTTVKELFEIIAKHLNVLHKEKRLPFPVPKAGHTLTLITNAPGTDWGGTGQFRLQDIDIRWRAGRRIVGRVDHHIEGRGLDLLKGETIVYIRRS